MSVGAIERRYLDAAAQPSDTHDHMPRFVDVAVRLGVTKVIELGVRNGMSSIAWIHAMYRTNGHCWSVDANPYGVSPNVQKVIQAGESFDRWTFVQGMTTDPDVLDQLPDDVGLVFIDSAHDYQTTWDELNLYEKKLAPNGIILLHDTEWPFGSPTEGGLPEVVLAIENFMDDHPNANNMYFTDSFGLGVIALDGNLPW